MQATIKVTIRDVYGKATLYPACDQARRLAALVGTKTLTNDTLRHWMSMGGALQYVDQYGRQGAREHQAMALI